MSLDQSSMNELDQLQQQQLELEMKMKELQQQQLELQRQEMQRRQSSRQTSTRTTSRQRSPSPSRSGSSSSDEEDFVPEKNNLVVNGKLNQELLEEYYENRSQFSAGIPELKPLLDNYLRSGVSYTAASKLLGQIIDFINEMNAETKSLKGLVANRAIKKTISKPLADEIKRKENLSSSSLNSRLLSILVTRIVNPRMPVSLTDRSSDFDMTTTQDKKKLSSQKASITRQMRSASRQMQELERSQMTEEDLENERVQDIRRLEKILQTRVGTSPDEIRSSFKKADFKSKLIQHIESTRNPLQYSKTNGVTALENLPFIYSLLNKYQPERYKPLPGGADYKKLKCMRPYILFRIGLSKQNLDQDFDGECEENKVSSRTSLQKEKSRQASERRSATKQETSGMTRDELIDYINDVMANKYPTRKRGFGVTEQLRQLYEMDTGVDAKNKNLAELLEQLEGADNPQINGAGPLQV